jgi:hypothetical protein
MGFFDKVLGKAAAAPIKAIGDIVDDIHTSKEEKLDAEVKLTEVAARLQSLQADITKQEANHRSLFVAGWRPSVGWLCSCGLAVNFVIAPLLSPYVILNTPNPDTMISLVLALCGIGGLRTIEKSRGLTK